jgi:hypothetical protein
MKLLNLAVAMALPSFCLAQYTYQHVDVDFLQSNNIAKNYTHENLRLYPVRAKTSFRQYFTGVGNYVPLQKAIVAQKVKITEQSQGGDVNMLSIQNISSDTIIVICGDVIKGGKQDRIISKDIVLPPKSGRKKLPVYCVESGRWSADRRADGEFNYQTKGAVSLRKVVEKEKSQTKVWSKVEEINRKNETTTETKTYTALTNSAGFTGKLAAYTRFFGTKFINDPDVIGVVAVTGNKVIGCDMFGTHDLFAGQYRSLLQSYATEAIVNGAAVSITPAAVKAYMDGLLKSETAQQETLKAKGSSFVEKGKKLRVTNFD